MEVPAPSSPQNSSISFELFSGVTKTLVDGQKEAAEAILEYSDLIVSHPSTRELVDLFFDTTTKSSTFLSDLERKLRNVRFKNYQLLLELDYGDESKRLESLGKLVAYDPENFLQPLLNALIKVIESYDDLKEKLVVQHKILLAEIQNLEEEKQKLAKQHQDLIDQAKAADKQPQIVKLMKKLWGTIVFTVQASFELSRGFITGDVVRLADLVSRRRHGREEADLSLALKFLFTDISEREHLAKIISSMEMKKHVVEAFKDIKFGVEGIAEQSNLVGESAGKALEWKKEMKEVPYNRTVELIRSEGAKLRKDMEDLETDIKDCRQNLTDARKAIIQKVIKFNG